MGPVRQYCNTLRRKDMNMTKLHINGKVKEFAGWPLTGAG